MSKATIQYKCITYYHVDVLIDPRTLDFTCEYIEDDIDLGNEVLVTIGNTRFIYTLEKHLTDTISKFKFVDVLQSKPEEPPPLFKYGV